MKGDFSRDTYNKLKHYSRVLMQQGRVQLDADWNEQAAILLHYMRTLAADLLGPFSGPAGAYGFEIRKVKESDDLLIGAGRYYVDGLLCENEEEGLLYSKQDDFPNSNFSKLDSNSKYIVYLDVWERNITALEDDEIHEKALNGADTATRTKIIWQVKIQKIDEDNINNTNVLNYWSKWINDNWQPTHSGCLQAQVKRPEDSNDPCLAPPDAKYRGQENQLYRIEIHKGGNAKEASFKWSRDNGSIVTGCELNGIELYVDDPYGFAANQWVELTNDGQELRANPGSLAKVIKVDGNVLTLAHAVVPSNDVNNEAWPKKVRRWDHNEKAGDKFEFTSDGAILVTEDDWCELENGIQIKFVLSQSSVNSYRTGDYWLIPARVATGNIEWPMELDANQNEKPATKPPAGIHHHYAPLAFLKYQNSNWSVTDLRCKFQPVHNTCGISYSYGAEGIGGHLLCDDQ